MTKTYIGAGLALLAMAYLKLRMPHSIWDLVP